MTTFTLKREGMFLFYSIPLIFIGYPFLHQVLFQSDVFQNIFTLFLYGIFSFTIVMRMYTHMSYFVGVSETAINFNNVATIPFNSIKGAYLGTIKDLESVEKRDNLPLESFKDEKIAHLFKVKASKRGNYPAGVFLVLHVGHTIYLIQASYFKRAQIEKLIETVESKAVQVERFEQKRMLHTKVI